MSLQYFPSIAPTSNTTNSFFLRRLAVGRAWGSAARAPNATMLSNAAPEAPPFRIRYSISAAISNSRTPGFTSCSFFQELALLDRELIRIESYPLAVGSSQQVTTRAKEPFLLLHDSHASKFLASL